MMLCSLLVVLDFCNYTGKLKIFDKAPRLRKLKENSISAKMENKITRREMKDRNENEQNMMRVRPKNISCINTIFTTFQCLKSFIKYPISALFLSGKGGKVIITLISLTLWRFLTFHFFLPSFFLKFVLSLHFTLK